jgi:hypothetical protein
MIDFVHIPKNAGTSIGELCGEGSFITYHGHGKDPDTLEGEQLVVLRDPKDRFCSAVRFSLAYMREEYSDKFKIFETHNLMDPSSWAEVLANREHVHHDLVNSEVCNIQHKVGNTLLSDKWTYAPQHIWFDRCRSPRVALFHELADDMRYLFVSMDRECNIPHENATCNKKDVELSNIAHEYLEEKYEKDIVIFNKYKTMSREERMKRHVV